MDSQTKRIYDYLLSGKTITPLEALNLFDCMRLSARIKDLRKLGVDIVTSMETHENKNGEKKRYARYWLK